MNEYHVVMMEDNPLDVDLLRMALDRQGEPYTLTVISDGAEALRFIYERHAAIPRGEPCVILLNVHLPKYDGIEVLAALKHEPHLRHVQVVMLSSGDVRPKEEFEIENWGAIFRRKPREFSEVLELAADVLEICKKTLTLV